MLVSICVLTYNNEDTLLSCLNSCLVQTYKNIEIVICNNSSTDNTHNIIKQFIKEHDNEVKIKYLLNCNSLTGGRNLLFNSASGAYIQNLDADDMLTPDSIEEKLKVLIENDYDVVGSKMYEYDGTEYKFNDRIDYWAARIKKNVNHDYQTYLLCYPSILFKKSVLNLFPDNIYFVYEKYFGVGTRGGEDKIFLLYLWYNNAKFGYCPKSLYYYNGSGSYFGKKTNIIDKIQGTMSKEDFLKYVYTERLDEYLTEHGII